MTDGQTNIQLTLSADELKSLIQEAVRDALLDILGEDMSSEPRFVPEIADRLKRYQQNKPAGILIDDVVKELGLDA